MISLLIKPNWLSTNLTFLPDTSLRDCCLTATSARLAVIVGSPTLSLLISPRRDLISLPSLIWSRLRLNSASLIVRSLVESIRPLTIPQGESPTAK